MKPDLHEIFFEVATVHCSLSLRLAPAHGCDEPSTRVPLGRRPPCENRAANAVANISTHVLSLPVDTEKGCCARWKGGIVSHEEHLVNSNIDKLLYRSAGRKQEFLYREVECHMCSAHVCSLKTYTYLVVLPRVSIKFLQLEAEVPSVSLDTI